MKPTRFAKDLAEVGEQPAKRTGAPEPTMTVYARVPWSMGEKLRDLARQRSKAEGRRVPVNELVTDAVSKLVS